MKSQLIVCMFFVVSLAVGQEAPERIRAIPFIKNPVQVDGIVTQSEWNAIDTLPIYAHWPDFSLTPNTRTLFRVARDETYLYFSAVCYGDPDLIQGPYFERDKWGMSMDQVAIVLDTYNDNENGVLFAVTPTGSRIDVSINNDADGASPVDLSWNSFWEARVSVNHEGWMAEMRIPFSSLRFQNRPLFPLVPEFRMMVLKYIHTFHIGR